MIAFNFMSQQHLFDPQGFKGVDQKSRISFNRISATNLTKEKKIRVQDGPGQPLRLNQNMKLICTIMQVGVG
jgi:hypothetical protein